MGIYQCDVTYMLDGLNCFSTAPVNVEIIPADIVNSNSKFYHCCCLWGFLSCCCRYLIIQIVLQMVSNQTLYQVLALINLYSSPNELTIYPTTNYNHLFLYPYFPPCGNDASSKRFSWFGTSTADFFSSCFRQFLSELVHDLSAVATGAVSYLWSTGITTQSISIHQSCSLLRSNHLVQVVLLRLINFLQQFPERRIRKFLRMAHLYWPCIMLQHLFNGIEMILWLPVQHLLLILPSASGNYTVVFTNG